MVAGSGSGTVKEFGTKFFGHRGNNNEMGQAMSNPCCGRERLDKDAPCMPLRRITALQDARVHFINDAPMMCILRDSLSVPRPSPPLLSAPLHGRRSPVPPARAKRAALSARGCAEAPAPGCVRASECCKTLCLPASHAVGWRASGAVGRSQRVAVVQQHMTQGMGVISRHRSCREGRLWV